MKSYVVAFTFLFLACQDSGENSKNKPTDLALYKNIGHQIPFETGIQWMEYYKQKNNKEGRLGLNPAQYVISDAQTEAMLESVSNLVGVTFHYALDEGETLHIIAIPVDESLSLWSSIPGRIYVDANTGAPISQSQAADWAQNYKDENPTDIWFHYFGATIFEEIVDIPFFNSIAVEPALDILNLTPQMLLIIWNEGTFLGRQKSPNGIIYDASSPCPPCAAE